MSEFQKLDTVANMFSSVTTTSNSGVFRVSALIDERVKPDLLQNAVETIMPRYPMFFTRIRRGIFWNYLDENNHTFLVGKEEDYPCKVIHPRENRGFMIRILYHHHRISVEVLHVLTDGSGLVEFLKSLLYYYYLEAYGAIDHEGLVLLKDDLKDENLDDAFIKYFSKVEDRQSLVGGITKDAYHIKGAPFHFKGNNVVSGKMSVKVLKEVAKRYGTSITGYLCSQVIMSIFEADRERYLAKKKAIVISVPVNLRKHYPSESLRNFFEVINVSVTVKSDMTIEDIIEDVTKQMNELVVPEHLASLSSNNVTMRQNLVSKSIPLILKKPLIKFGFHFFGEKKKTMTISNIGSVVLPLGLQSFVRGFEAVLYPTPKSPINCGVISTGDALTLSFSRTIRESKMIEIFFKRITDDADVGLSVYSNNWGVYYE